MDATTPEPAKVEKTGPGVGYVTHGFPAAGLRRTVRIITGHNAEGKGVFLSTDCGDHHRVMGEEEAIANILYSTRECPVDMEGDVDVAKAKEAEVSIDQGLQPCQLYRTGFDNNSLLFTTTTAALSAWWISVLG